MPDQRGLTSKEAEEKLERFGPNVLPEKPPPSGLAIFLSQFKSPLVYILIVAGLTTLVLRHFSDSAIIFFAVFINTVLGFIQERRASKALFALKHLIHPKAKLLRGGKQREIDVENVVPGDVAILSEGTKVPADGKLISANRLFLGEAILTGESVPAGKKVDGKVFMGTIVTSGRGQMLVENTGGETEIGKIATSVQEPYEETPLKRQLSTFSRQLAIFVFILLIFVFVIGLLTGKGALEIFVTSVALAVSAIPEGLLVALTVILAIGMQKILKKKGLVRNLLSAETLGGVTTICVDKTGTLTEGEMKVTDVSGIKNDAITQGILANDLEDPLTVALWDWAKKNLKARLPDTILARHRRLDSIPFSSDARFFASLNKWDETSNMIFVNGAPEFLIEWSSLGEEERESITKEIDQLTREGKRLVGLARRRVKSSKIKISVNDVKKGLDWIGLVAFTDPVRPGVKEAFEKTATAGISVIVITGDYPKTAVSVMRNLSMDVGSRQIVTGETLARMSIETLTKKISDVKLFARTTPQQKLKIVESLKEKGETVAMMGDGVNDTPALNRADIGIVVGEATDVAKETADLVLLDSNFATIIAAIEEGRGIFANIRKIILYLMSDAFEEIIAVVGALVLGLPLPVSASQILWINLISDGLPNLALTVDPLPEGAMNEPPRSPKTPLLASWIKILIFIVSLSGGIMALALFTYFYKTTNDLTLARSVAFATLGVNSLVYVFSVRTLTSPFWVENPFKNRWLNVAAIGGLFFQLAPFTFSGAKAFFGLTTLSPAHWVLVFSASAIMFIIIEVSKFVFREKLTNTR